MASHVKKAMPHLLLWGPPTLRAYNVAYTMCAVSTHVVSIIKGAAGCITGQEMMSRLSSFSKWDGRGPEEERAPTGEQEKKVRCENRGVR